jgi:proline iminopeptidase
MKIAIIIISNIMVLGAVAFFALMMFGSFPAYKPGQMALKPDAESYLTPPAQSGSRSDYWKVRNDIELYYFTEGEGSPVLVLHGGPGFPSNKPWKGLSLLTKQYKFHYFHTRGCGKSTRPFDRFESRNYYRNMLALIDTLGIEQQIADIERIRRILKQDKLILIGHSFGGFTAALYALEFPDRVDRLVLVAPATILSMPPVDGGLYESVKRMLPPVMLEEYSEFLKRFFDYGSIFNYNEREHALLNADFGRFYFAALQNQGVAFSDTGFSAKDVGGFITPAIFMSLGRSYDHTEAFAAVSCPTLVIQAEDDPAVTPAGVQTYQQAIGNCTVKLIKNAGHHCFNDNPEEFAGLVAAFLE